jgi:ribonuclease PH
MTRIRQIPKLNADPIWECMYRDATVLPLPLSYNPNMVEIPHEQGRSVSDVAPAAPVFYRSDGRTPSQLRPLMLTPDFVRTAEGSVLITVGHTRVLCNATIENGVPGWLRNSGRGWVTAEYAMLPRSTVTRSPRESERGKIGGRTHEIQRLIGRSLRAVVDRKALGPWTIHIDADVLNADGGTRTAAITAAFIAVADAVNRRFGAEACRAILPDSVAAVSAGIVAGVPVLDLDYREDSTAEVDINVVRLGSGGLVEVQGTGEGGTFSRGQLDALLNLAEQGITQLTNLQRESLGPDWPLIA